jgi:pyridoxamine 5'-phosphate oxidase
VRDDRPVTTATPEDGPQVGPEASPLPDMAALRIQYDQGILEESSLAPSPLAQFAAWFQDAADSGIVEPNAMVLATSDDDGPTARTVLLKGVDGRGFTFFTNHDSRKGRQLHANPRASLVFPWLSLHRQVVVTGDVVLLSRDEVEAYFTSRPRGSRIGAWASPQSTEITSREVLEESYADAEQRFGDDVPTPSHWGGYLVMPRSVEFWQGRPSRLHDRLVFQRDDVAVSLAGGGAHLDEPGHWQVRRLAP